MFPPVTYSLLIWIILLTYTTTSLALYCFSCESTTSDGCGPRFRTPKRNAIKCTESQTLCAIQRQEAIPELNQIAAITRGCYEEGLKEGMNSSIGCHIWINKAENYEALYCFCDTNYCNSAKINSASIANIFFPIIVTIITVVRFQYLS